jgi:phosphopentomutase
MMDKHPFKRWIVIVLDGVGAGAAPDAADYGDVGTNSLGNTARVVGGLALPNMAQLGIGYITPMVGVERVANPSGAYGKMAPRSAGKDTIAGHWELMGVHLEQAMPLFPNGFPPEVLEPFSQASGRGVLGNIPASGTEIIQVLGKEHVETGKLIVYTSGDSCFQVAAHEEVVPLEELYHICEIARAQLRGKFAVGRVIARPFLGPKDGKFYRTEHRKDYPLLPATETVLESLIAAGYTVCSVGKIDDIFANRGISTGKHTVNNRDGLEATLNFMAQDFSGMIFTNLIEFDMIYGHRNDPHGYAQALQLVDSFVPTLQAAARPGDVLMFVADHGVDPTTPGTDHSRENIPLLVFGPKVRPGVDLGMRSSFSDAGATILENFGLEQTFFGKSFLGEIKTT